VSANTPATSASASRSPPENHDDTPALTETAADAPWREELECAFVLPVDRPAAPPTAPRPPLPEPRPTARPPPPSPIAPVPRGEAEEGEESVEVGVEEEEEPEEPLLEPPPESPPEPPPGPFSNVAPMIVWAPAPGPP
jgi:hypothetical protein